MLKDDIQSQVCSERLTSLTLFSKMMIMSIDEKCSVYNIFLTRCLSSKLVCFHVSLKGFHVYWDLYAIISHRLNSNVWIEGSVHCTMYVHTKESRRDTIHFTHRYNTLRGSVDFGSWLILLTNSLDYRYWYMTRYLLRFSAAVNVVLIVYIILLKLISFFFRWFCENWWLMISFLPYSK